MVTQTVENMHVCLNIQASLRLDGTDGSLSDVHQCSREADETNAQEKSSSSGSLAESELPDQAEGELAEMIIVAHTGKEQLKVNLNTQNSPIHLKLLFSHACYAHVVCLSIPLDQQLNRHLSKKNAFIYLEVFIYFFIFFVVHALHSPPFLSSCVRNMTNTLFSDTAVEQ